MIDKTFEVERKELAQILDRKHYTVDFYQREYGWGRSQMRDLLQDLYGRFSEDYDRLEKTLPTTSFAPVGFGSYFLGSYVISAEEAGLSIVDGQQRLTSLSVIFLYLLEHIPSGDKYSAARDLEDLISSRRSGGRESYNIKTPVVKEGFKKIKMGEFEDGEPNLILDRYRDVKKYLDSYLANDEKRFHYFLHWLREKVLLVEIRTYSVVEAYTIFETMNDRGLSLTDHEMLKGFLLSNISTYRAESLEIWNGIINRITTTFGQGDISRFFTSVLRGRYGQWQLVRNVIRTYSTAWSDTTYYYRWMRENAELMGLKGESDFFWLLKELEHLSKWYVEINNRVIKHHPDTENLWLFGSNNTNKGRQSILFYILPALFSVLHKHDEEIILSDELKRLNIIGRFYDTLRALLMWNSAALAPRGQESNLVSLFRGEETDKIAFLCRQYLNSRPELFLPTSVPSYKKKTNRELKYLLLRIHDLFEKTEGLPEYTLSADHYDIEHMLANHDENVLLFTDEEEFNDYRNQIGALLILPKSRNSSLQNMKYADKVNRYRDDGVLASLAAPGKYDYSGKLLPNHPGLSRLEKKMDIAFKAYPNLGVEEIKSRNKMYASAAQEVWNLDWFIEQTGYSLEDLEELYENDKKVNDPFFANLNVRVIDKTQTQEANTRALQLIYQKLGGVGASLEMEYQERGIEVEGILLNKEGTLSYEGHTYVTLSPVVRALNLDKKSHASAWSVLYLYDKKTSSYRNLVDLREEINRSSSLPAIENPEENDNS